MLHCDLLNYPLTYLLPTVTQDLRDLDDCFTAVQYTNAAAELGDSVAVSLPFRSTYALSACLRFWQVVSIRVI